MQLAFRSSLTSSAVKELGVPELDGYELLTESHAVKIYHHFRDSDIVVVLCIFIN